MSTVRILIADGHEVIRAGLRQFLALQENVRIVGEAANVTELVDQVGRKRPDVVILEPATPEIGMEAIGKLRSIQSAPRIVVLTSHESASLAQKAMGAGASGYVLKLDPAEKLLKAINTVIRGLTYVSPAVTMSLPNATLRGPEPSLGRSRPILTKREMEILHLLALGKSSKEISAVLMVSVRTIETHRANMMRKLEMHSVTEMLHFAFENRLLESNSF